MEGVPCFGENGASGDTRLPASAEHVCRQAQPLAQLAGLNFTEPRPGRDTIHAEKAALAAAGLSRTALVFVNW